MFRNEGTERFTGQDGKEAEKGKENMLKKDLMNEVAEEDENEICYAVMHEDYIDWDIGSENLNEAIAIADEMCEDPEINTESVEIAKLEHCERDPFCVGVCEYGKLYYPKHIPTSDEDFPNYH